MATGTGANQGKTAFAERYFADHRDADEEAVNRAWKAAGNEGELSGSLIYKVRSGLGLTGRKGAEGGASGRATKGRAGSAPKQRESGEARSRPEDSGNGPGTNKSAFVEAALRRNPQANLAAVNRAWSEAGNEGTISDSVFYKVKRERGGDDRSTPAGPVEPNARPATRPGVGARPGHEGETGPDSAGGRTGPGDRERVLDRVEDGIDDLIVELKQMGGLEEALEALRKARRVVVRSHEG